MGAKSAGAIKHKPINFSAPGDNNSMDYWKNKQMTRSRRTGSGRGSSWGKPITAINMKRRKGTQRLNVPHLEVVVFG